MKKIKLVAPAGDIEKLKFSVLYGADAVYFSGRDYGLRAGAGNFDLDQMAEGVRFAHSHDVRAYLAMNIFAHNRHFSGLETYLRQAADTGIDAVIVSDPGIFRVVQETIPQMRIHISTQANVTNRSAAEFWHSLGASRVVVARELSLDEIKQIASKSPVELEAFVHGAMCISYSGRCLLSSFLADRSANLGDCTYPCRWKYRVEEEKRPGQYLDVEEDRDYSYIFHSRDLCMIEHLPEMIEAGLCALKIEGRMKSVYYHAICTRIYRQAIDAYYRDPRDYHCKKEWLEELAGLTRRGYTTGFYLGRPDHTAQKYEGSDITTPHSFLGYVIEDGADRKLKIKAKNKITDGDIIEFVGPDAAKNRRRKVLKIFRENMTPAEYTFPNETVYVEIDGTAKRNDIIRKVTVPQCTT